MADPTIQQLDATSSNTFVEDGAAVVVDGDVTLQDTDLTDYDGASLTVARNGGADGEDEFAFSTDGNVTFDDTAMTISVSGTQVATYTMTGGTLAITFGASTQAQVNEVAQAIEYSNSSDAPAASVDLDYTFDSGEAGDTADTETTTVNITAVNDAPTVDTEIPDTDVDEDDDTFTLDVSGNFDDGDGDTLTFSADTDGSGLPDWLSLDQNTGVFSGTPEQADVGSVDITVTAEDGDGEAVTDTFTLTVDEVNDGPTADNPIAAQTTPEDATFSFTVPANTFSDEEGDEITLSATQSDGTALPDFLTFDPATGTFSGTPGQADVDAGQITVRVTATTPDDETVFSDFTLDVTEVDDAPEVGDAIEDVEIDEEGAVSFTVPAGAFTHDDGDDLDFRAVQADGTALPLWLTLDRETGAITGDAPEDFNGTIGVVLTAFDEDLESVQQTFDIVVNAVNDAPTVAAEIADQAVEEDGEVGLVLPEGTFADVDGDALTLSAVETGEDDLPEFLTFDAATGTFSGTAPEDDETDVSITVTADDGAGGTVTDTFVIDFTPVQDAAEITGDTAGVVGEDDVAADGTATGQLASTDVDAEDDDDDFVAASDDATYGSWSIDASGAWTYTLDDDDDAVDGLDDGEVLSDSFTITTGDGTEQEIDITIFGGTDFAFGDGGDNTITTGSGDDVISGGGGDDVLDGGAGDDTIRGGAGDDTMTGGAGDDTIGGGAGDDTAVFAGGFDAFTFMVSEDGRSLMVTDGDDADGDEGTDMIRSDVETIQFGDGGSVTVTSERGLVTGFEASDAGGNVTASSESRTAADGRFTTETFEGGVRTARVRVDSDDDVRSWSRISEEFDADGDVSRKEVTIDDGRSVTTTFEDGELTSRVRVDSEDDLRSWAEIGQFFEDGELVRREVLRDDGRRIIREFEDGELVNRQVIEPMFQGVDDTLLG